MNNNNNSKKFGFLFVILVFCIFELVSSAIKGINNIVTNDSKTFKLLLSSENKDLELFIKNYFKKEKMKVKIDYAGTLDIMDKINNKEDYDAIWASNSIWLYMLESTSSVSNSKSTSIDPIVFGVKKSKAEKLGLIDKEIYTTDLLEKIKNKELNFVMNSATRTNTGASAYLGFLTTLAGSPEVLTVEHLNSETLKNDITSFLSGIERTSGSEEFLEELLLDNKYDAVVAYESSFINLNKTLVSEGKEPFYLIYPVDGVTISDSPLAYVANGNNHKEEFLKFQEYVISDKGKEELAKLGRRTWYGGTNLNADENTFNKKWGIDTSKYIVPIKYPSTTVIKKALELYQTEFRKPTHIVFCLDYSGSMYGDGNEQLIDAMEYILNYDTASTNMLQFSYKDKISTVLFSNDIIGEYKTDNGTIVADLINYIKNTEPYGGTNLYGSLESALEILENENSNDYNLSIILMTDGQGNVGTFNEFKYKYDMINKDIPIYGIMFGSADDYQLLEISKYTGGKVFDGRINLLETFKEVRGYN